jgi:hypothetical protein
MNRNGVLVLRGAIAVTLLTSGVIHADLYLHGYRVVPVVGPAFLLQASLLVALAVLIAVGGPRWLHAVAGVVVVGSLVAFGLSRTVGISGFVEHGWQPAPQAAVSVVAEVLAAALCAVSLTRNRVTPLTIH